MSKYENSQLMSFKNEDLNSYSISNMLENTANTQSFDISLLSKSRNDHSNADTDKDINVESFAEFVKSIEKVLSKNDKIITEKPQAVPISLPVKPPVDNPVSDAQNTNHFRGSSFGVDCGRVVGHPPLCNNEKKELEV